jgi:NDP-sugar pyrophosphorylase family protein
LGSTISREPLPTVCILAGGLGTRLGSLVADTPKPLIEVAGEAFLLHQLRLLASHGATEAVVCVGYLGDRIEEQIGPQRFGIRLAYSYDGPAPAGTLGAVRRATPMLPNRFLVLYGDAYLRLDYRAAVEAWELSGRPALMTVLRNRGRWDTSNAVYENGRVTCYDKQSPTASMQWIDYGLGGLEIGALELVDERESDLSSLQHRLAESGQLCGFEATERFYEIGTPEGLAETDAFFRSQERSRPGSRKTPARNSSTSSTRRRRPP